MTHLRQAWDLPAHPRPIVIIGAGGIVRTAHLPAYRRVRFPVAGLFDIDASAASETGRRFGVPAVFSTFAEAASVPDAVFDVAVPGRSGMRGARAAPAGSARSRCRSRRARISTPRAAFAQVCRERRLVAAVNFQLRFSPNVLAVKDLLAGGALGEIVDLEVRLVVKQPWHLWTFLERASAAGDSLPFDSLPRRDPVDRG